MVAPPVYLLCACSSGEEFVAAFRRYADKGGIFIPLAEPIPANKKGRFALALLDGGVMIEGEAEVVASSKSPSPLYGRVGMTIRFVELDDASKTTLAELDRARLIQKVVAPSIPPRLLADTLPPGPRPVVPPPSGRIDAANALAESVVLGDLSQLKDLGPKTAGPKFVIPSIPSAPVGAPRARTPSAFPIVAAREQAATPGERGRPATQPPPPAGSTPITPGPNTPPRARGGTMPPPAKVGDTQPVAVVPPPRQDQNERRADRSASLPPLEALKVGSTQAVAVVPPPQWSTTAKNLFGDADAIDTDTLRAAPKAEARDPNDDDSLDDLKPIGPATIPMPRLTDEVQTRPPPQPTATIYAMTPAPEGGVVTLDTTLPDGDPTEDREAVVPPPKPVPPELQPTIPTTPITPVPMVTITQAMPPMTPTSMTIATPPIVEEDPIVAPPAPPAPPVTPSLADLVRSAAAAAKGKPRIDSNPTIRGTAPPAKPMPLNRQQLAALEVDEKTDLTSAPPIAPELRMTSVGVGAIAAHDTEILAAQGDVDVDLDDDAKLTSQRPAMIETPLDGSPPLAAAAKLAPTVEEPTPSGNWTMTMDGAIQQLPPPAKPPAPVKTKLDTDADWTITPDQEAPSWIGAAPTRPDTASGIAGGTGATPGKTKVIDAVTTPGGDVDRSGPKIQIDPSLVGGPAELEVSGVIGGGPKPARVGVGVAAAHGDETPLPLPSVPVGPPPPVVVEAISMMPQPVAVPPMVIPTPYPLMQAPPMTQAPMAPVPLSFAPSSTGSNPRLPSNQENGYYPSLEDSVRNAQPVRDETMNVGGKRKPKGRGGLIVILVSTLLVLGAGGFALWYFVLNKKGPTKAPAPTTQPVTSVGSATPPPPPPVGSGSGSGSDATPMIAVGSGSGSDGSGSGSAAGATDSGECIVDVVTNPPEAAIFDDRNLRLGTSPAKVKVPCGATRLVLRKDTYAETIRPVVATADGNAKLRAALVHAPLSVKVSSTPAGATVSVGGKSKGVTPTTMQLPMLESSTIVFTKDGFQTESEKITPRQPNQAVHVQLKRKGGGQRLK